MKLWTRWLVPAVVSCGLMVTLAACGSSSKSSSSGGSGSGATSLKPALNGSGQTLTGGKRGGVLTAYSHEDYKNLDPGQAYFSLDYSIIYVTQTPLFYFAPNNAQTAEPLLAAGPAQVSGGGNTVTVHIRHGVKYAPPVNREVTTADVKFAIERGANPNVANGYFPSYFAPYVVGAAKATGGPISGITTPDKYTIVFHLTGSYATFFIGALSLPLSSPVPPEFVRPLDKHKPTTYGAQYLTATGPYMVKQDATGKFAGIGYSPGKSLALVRNPNWSSSGDPRPAYLDGINVQIGGDTNVIGQQVLTGSHAVQEDTPAGPIVKKAYQQYYNQLIAVPGAGNHYVALNNKSGPFSNVNARKALWAALDREQMIKLDGGQIVAQVGTHFIYPSSAGYQQSGGDKGPNVDYNNYPTGNMALAEKYMKAAGYPSGKYTGSYIVKVVGATGDPADKYSAVVNHAVQSLGFKTNFSLVDQSAIYGKYCGNPSAKVDVCPSVGWIRDWADPQTLLTPIFAGYNIVPTNNNNFGLVSWQDWPKAAGGTYTSGPLTPLDQAMKSAEKTVGETARAQAWAKVDTMLVNQAVAVPWVFDIQPNIMSKDVQPVNDLWDIGTFDYAFTSLK